MSYSFSKVFSVVVPIVMTSSAFAADTLYSASFDWKGVDSKTSQPMHIVLTKNSKPRFNEARAVAKIMSGSRVEALCQVSSVEVRDGMGSAEMSCKSTAFGTLASPATVFFNIDASKSSNSLLRFGTWLQGYEQVSLKVETNRGEKLIQLMTQSQVELAQSR